MKTCWFCVCRYAGVYTAEEVALITRDKLIRLQSLYIDQFKRLQHIMREKRRKYLHTYQMEKESLGTLYWNIDFFYTMKNLTTKKTAELVKDVIILSFWEFTPISSFIAVETEYIHNQSN